MNHSDTPTFEQKAAEHVDAVRGLTADELLTVSGGPQIVNDGGLLAP